MELGYHVALVKDTTAAYKAEGMKAAETNAQMFAHTILTTGTAGSTSWHLISPAPRAGITGPFDRHDVSGLSLTLGVDGLSRH
jgi:hypothetical protein